MSVDLETADLEEAKQTLRGLVHKSRSERCRRLFDFDPWDYQQAILDDPTPDVVTTCGRQVGKTETAGAIAADGLITSDGYDVMIAAKWQETADEVLRRAKKHLRNAGLEESHRSVESWNKREVETAVGARLYSRTLKVTDGDAETGDTQRGKLPRVVVLDESALIDGDAVTSVIRPMFLTYGDDHELYLFSTPRGKQGYHYEKHKNDPSWSAHHVPSSASPLIDDDYLEQERRETTDLEWRQEYLGEFIDLGEVYIPGDTYDACVTAGRSPSIGRDPFLGVDVARKGRDRTVYLGVDAAGHVEVFDAEDLSDTVGVVERIGTLHDRHGFRAIGVDENSVGGGVVDFAAHGIDGVVEPIPFSTKRKGKMYRKLKADLEAGELQLPDPAVDEHTERLRDETVNLQYDYTQNGHLRVSHVPGGRDDYADALAVANWVRENADAATEAFMATKHYGVG